MFRCLIWPPSSFFKPTQAESLVRQIGGSDFGIPHFLPRFEHNPNRSMLWRCPAKSASWRLLQYIGVAFSYRCHCLSGTYTVLRPLLSHPARPMRLLRAYFQTSWALHFVVVLGVSCRLPLGWWGLHLWPKQLTTEVQVSITYHFSSKQLQVRIY